MSPVAKAARNAAISGAIIGTIAAVQTYRYNKLMSEIDAQMARLHTTQSELLSWPANAPQEVKNVLFGNN